MRKVYTIGQVARICRVSHRTVQKWFDGGILQGYRVPNSQDRRVLRESLLSLIDQYHLPTDLLNNLDCNQVLFVGTDENLVSQLSSSRKGSQSEKERRRSSGDGTEGSLYHLQAVADSFSAGRATALIHYHAVLVCLSLGRNEAITLARQLRAAPGYGSTYLAALAWEDETDSEQLLEAGYSEVLCRPFDPAELARGLSGLPRTESFGKVSCRRYNLLGTNGKVGEEAKDQGETVCQS